MQIPTDFKCEQTINQDQSETIKIAFTAPEHSDSYKLEIDLGDGFEDVQGNTLNAEQTAKLSKEHQIRFQAFTSDAVAYTGLGGDITDRNRAGGSSRHNTFLLLKSVVSVVETGLPVVIDLSELVSVVA